MRPHTLYKPVNDIDISSIMVPLANFSSVFALVFVPQHNEKYYDLGGAVGFISTTFVSLYYPSLKESLASGKFHGLAPLSSFAPRQLLLSAALGVWATRLGSFLVQVSCVYTCFSDTTYDQEPSRELLKLAEIPDSMRSSTSRPILPSIGSCKVLHTSPISWNITDTGPEATWVCAVGLPVYLANAIPANAHPRLGMRDYVSFSLFAGSFLFEALADRQKTAWRRRKDAKEHDEQFISSGLWSLSRHPK